MQRVEAQLRDCRGTVMTQPESQVFYGFILHFVFTLTWKACDGRALSQQPDARFEIVRWDSTWQNVNAEVSHGNSFAQGIQVIKVVISITILISEEPFYCFGVFAALLACEVCPTFGKLQANESKYKVELNKAFDCTKINIKF